MPVCEGYVYHISAHETVTQVLLSIYLNGFAFLKNTDSNENEQYEIQICVNPFVLVRNCKFFWSKSHHFEDLHVFKVVLLSHDASYLFGCTSSDERIKWMSLIAHSIKAVTCSIYPIYNLSIIPIKNNYKTVNRILSGYLIILDPIKYITASIVYCELQAQTKQENASFILYENSQCLTTIKRVDITENTPCYEKVSFGSCVFVIDTMQFAGRSANDRKLWLRVISNIKVKVLNKAPPPSQDELYYYRISINDQLKLLQNPDQPMTDPLLQRTLICPIWRLPLVRGDEGPAPTAPKT
eukprot:GHVL01014483.1.p1 GENE.GHVL01014483.1~~GHVL01014483.1.p1  ORF type:complete len:297 (-),score=48.94 GHVL01014483.1:61-951(-)